MNRKEKLEQMLAGQPGDPFLHYALAMECVKEGQTAAALERFDKALSFDPSYVAAYFHKANTLVAQNQFDDAKAALRAGIEAARTKGDTHAEGEMQGLLDSIE